MRRGRWRRAGWDWTAALLVAFGLGLFLALICSARLVLFILAVALIYVGFTNRC